jgi:hypothetical protein
MTVAAGTAVRRYDGNDVAVDFAFPEIFYNNSDLVLYHRDVNGVITNPTIVTDYLVTGVGTATSGSVEFPVGGSSYSTLATGEKLTISRESAKSRTTDMNDAFYFDDLNLGEDKTMTMVQENALGVDRSIRRHITDLDSLNMELPIDTERANKSILFNPDGSVGVGAVAASVITSGSGAPTSTPSNLGDIYIDTTGDIFYIATGTASSADWSVASLITSQAGAPSSTPAIVGLINIDTTNNKAYIAVGTSSSADWALTSRQIRHLDFNCVGAKTDCATDTNIYGDHVMKFGGTILQSDTNKQWLMANNSIAGITSTMVVDIHKNGTTIMATNKLDIETTEKTTEDAITQPDLTVTTVAAGDIITIDIDAVHSGTAAKGLSVTMSVLQDA